MEGLRPIVILLGILSIVLSQTCWAKGDKREKDAVKLEEMVVTATRTERPIGSVPASVTVITRKDIERSPAQSADELLEDVAGVFVRHPTGVSAAGVNNIVYMRGLGGKTAMTVSCPPKRRDTTRGQTVPSIPSLLSSIT